MSFILEALRRAEAERERGQVPGLHSPGLPGPATTGLPPPAGRPRPWAGALAGLLAGAVLALAAAWWWRSTAAAPAAPAAPVASAAAALTAAPAAASGPAGALVSPDGSSLIASTGALPRPQAQASADSEPLQPGAARVPGPAPIPAQPSAPVSQRPPPATVAGTPATGAAVAPLGSGALKASAPLLPASAARASTGGPAAGSQLPQALAEPGAAPAAPAASATSAAGGQGLSAEQRRRLPPLKIGGSMYSEERSSRMLVVNEQLLREGDRAAGGVVLERIGPSAAQFSFEGRRFELPY